MDLRSLPAGWNETDLDLADWADAVTVNAMGHGEPGRQEPPNHPYGPFGPNPVSARNAVDLALRPTDGRPLGQRPRGRRHARARRRGSRRRHVKVTAAERHRRRHRSSPTRSRSASTWSSTATAGSSRASTSTASARSRSRPTTARSSTASAVRERLFPTVGGASFACSDPLLDEIWAVGRRTVSICSLDAYVDCPTREQRAWTGDSVVHQMVDLTTNADWCLARWHPLLAASPRADGMLPMAVRRRRRAGRLHDHPGLGAALGPLGAQPLPLRRRPRGDRRAAAGRRGRGALVRALPRRRRAASPTSSAG